MKAREVCDGVHWVGAVDWDRRLFDSLFPIPEGTSYNSYLVRGSEGTALIDTIEPHFADVLFARLDDLGVERLDYVVANHAEQDHSGALPQVLERFPDATVVCSPKARGMLADLLPLPEERFRGVADGEEISLGDRTLRFVHFPWVHWPETMLTHVPELKTLFPCDLFGSHLASNRLVVDDVAEVRAAARLYYAQIMMPFRRMIARKLGAVEAMELDRICPSHGPVHGDPAGIVASYRGWIGDTVRNRVVLPYITMHESTRVMVDHLVDALTDRNVRVERFNIENIEIGRLASALVDAATVVVGTPTVLGGAHPNAVYAALLANLLRPKLRFASVVGSYGWGGKAVDQVVGALSNLDVDLLEPVLSRGTPDADALAALERLADDIATRHAEIGAID